MNAKTQIDQHIRKQSSTMESLESWPRERPKIAVLIRNLEAKSVVMSVAMEARLKKIEQRLLHLDEMETRLMELEKPKPNIFLRAWNWLQED